MERGSTEHFRPNTLWPATGLDVADLMRGGWEPLPFVEFVVKIHSR